MDSTAIILNWNTLNVSKDSLRRLRKEVPVIFVDNGSTDGTREYYKNKEIDGVEFLFLDKNVGNCSSRNQAIDKVKTKYFFLLDGDILYVPGSISVLESILEAHSEAGIVGVFHPSCLTKYGHTGSPILAEAELKAYNSELFGGFPMAWTQYGLFRKTDQRFIEEPPFDQAGMGYEDSYYYWEMKEAGFESYFIQTPVYYHEAHSGFRELAKTNLPSQEEKRRSIFEKRFGKIDWKDHHSIFEV